MKMPINFFIGVFNTAYGCDSLEKGGFFDDYHKGCNIYIKQFYLFAGQRI